jgi:hypothetical protein
MVGDSFTVNVKLCAPDDPLLLFAVNVMAYVPPLPTAGVPDKVPVPSALSVNVTLLGSALPPSTIDGTGVPVVVTVNVPDEPTVKVVAGALVIVGAWPTAKLCCTCGAGLHVASPAWSALITQLLDAPLNETVDPDTEQIVGDPLENVTAKPEVAAALTE